MTPRIRALILDMDGVLWRGDEWLIDPQKAFGRLRDAGMAFAMATNNATRTIPYYLEKFAAQGVSLEPWQVINSGTATANLLADEYPERGELFVVGEWGLEQTLAERGFTIGEHNPVAVVCGMDRQVTYDKLEKATHFVRSGARFIGTNPDRSFPTPRGLSPGAGAILAAIAAAADVEPEIVGKPETTMYEQLLPHLDCTASEALVVGDRLETDIAGAQQLGCPSAVVLSGVATADAVEKWRPQPDYICADLLSLLDKILS